METSKHLQINSKFKTSNYVKAIINKNIAVEREGLWLKLGTIKTVHVFLLARAISLVWSVLSLRIYGLRCIFFYTNKDIFSDFLEERRRLKPESQVTYYTFTTETKH